MEYLGFGARLMVVAIFASIALTLVAFDPLKRWLNDTRIVNIQLIGMLALLIVAIFLAPMAH